ncbi:MAG TPA: polysaccharide pyruvyl transferase family protein, partial [Oligoflexia bacterium]|nr:polysaccharide pyruvyl transferase family protein [Oligoflexia bacterium]
MLKSITLLGSSSGRNAGDAALLSAIMDSVDRSCGTRLLYEIPTIKPGFIRNNYNNRVQPISMLPWHASVKMFGVPTCRSIMRTDLSLIFDAILFDRALYNPLFNFLSTLYLLLPRAKRRGKKIACFNVGTGPVTTPAGQRMLRELAEIMEFITVRDQSSLDILKDIGVKNERLILTADAALNVAPCDEERIRQIFSQLKLNPEQEILGININSYIDTWAGPDHQPMGKAKFLTEYAAALSRAARKLHVPLLFVCSQHNDVAITKE